MCISQSSELICAEKKIKIQHWESAQILYTLLEFWLRWIHKFIWINIDNLILINIDILLKLSLSLPICTLQLTQVVHYTATILKSRYLKSFKEFKEWV